MSKIHHKKSIGAASAGHESESTEGGWDLLYCLIKINLVCPMPRLRGWNEQQEVVNPPRPQPSTLLLFFVCLLSIERIECRGAKADGDGSATLSSETREERKWEEVKRSAEEIIRRLFRPAVTSWKQTPLCVYASTQDRISSIQFHVFFWIPGALGNCNAFKKQKNKQQENRSCCFASIYYFLLLKKQKKPQEGLLSRALWHLLVFKSLLDDKDVFCESDCCPYVF